VSRNAVLLLGGRGFIGSALATRLEQKKTSVHIVGRDNIEQLEDLLSRSGCVVHLACATTPGSSASRPELELGNIALTAQLVALLEKQPPTHLIFFSSGGTVYGNPARLPAAEEDPTAPLSHHGVSKSSQEACCQAARNHGHAVTILRPSNAYGPGQRMKSGFGLVRTMLEHARAGTPLEIWGDGENVRDFIYIDDVVEACMRFIALPGDSGTYNLGTGIGVSINQLKVLVEVASGRRLEAIYRPARGIDVRSVVLDTSRLQTALDWRPSIGLADGLTRTWQWLSPS
jgi:UDP-glucose 4-epimerase